MFAKRSYYLEIWFCNQYYIGGVNILEESQNRKFIKIVDLIQRGCNKNFLYRKINKAKLYEFFIGGKRFKIAIAEIEEGIWVIAFLSGIDLRLSAKINDRESRNKNRQLLYAFALNHIVAEEQSERFCYVYSSNKEMRAKLEKLEDKTTIVFQKFFVNPDAEIDFPDDLKENPYQHLGWYEDEQGLSVYPDFESAIKDAEKILSGDNTQQKDG